MVPQFILDLPTPRLLKYFRKHLRDRRGHVQYAYDNEHIEKDQYDEFMEDYNAVKEELSIREHVDEEQNI